MTIIRGVTKPDETRANLIEKVRKLTALTNSPNEHEAAAAAARVADLLAKHRITSAEIDAAEGDDGFEQVTDAGTTRKNLATWCQFLASGVASALGCWATCSGPRVTYYGRDASSALYLFRVLRREIERLAKLNARGQGTAYANAYRVGMATTLAVRLNEQRVATIVEARKAGASAAALARVDSAQDDAKEWALGHLGFVGKAGRAPPVDGDGYHRGRADGRSIDVGMDSRVAIGTGPLALGSGAE